MRIIWLQYYTPSIWLAADWARFPCNHQALLPWCPRHKQALFNLLVDIHFMVNWQCQNKIHWPVSHDCIMGSSVHLTEVTCFLKVICWPLVVYYYHIWSLAQLFLVFYNNRAKKAKYQCSSQKIALEGQSGRYSPFLGARYFKKGPMYQYLSNMQKRRSRWKVKEMKMSVYLKLTWSIPFYTQ